MRIILLSFSILAQYLAVVAQLNTTGSDTITFSYRTGGKLDSVDLFSDNNSFSFSGGGLGTSNNTLTADFFFHHHGGQLFWNNLKSERLRYSGLPHLGVAYMFGSNSLQNMKAEFHQAFKGNVMLNILYDKATSNGILRNSSFNHENVRLYLGRRSKIHSFNIHAGYLSSKVSQSGGLQADSLANFFDLQFLPVKKENAETFTQRSRIQLDNYFDLSKDSIREFGFCVVNKLQVKKYRFNETDTLWGIYPLVNIDSNQTNDRHQWSGLTNGFGVFYRGDRLFWHVTPEMNYWNFQNSGRYNDTLETSLRHHFALNNQGFYIINSGLINLKGANQEWSNDLKVSYKIQSFALDYTSSLKSILPDYYQRYAIGNNTLPVATSWGRQRMEIQKFRFSYHANPAVFSIELGNSRYNNNYWFINSIWRNDTLSNVTSWFIGSSFSFQARYFHVHGMYQYVKMKGSAMVIPEHQVWLRTFLKGKLFKGRKMNAVSGMEIGYYSSYQAVGYFTQVSSLGMIPTGKTMTDQITLHCFGGFEIDAFRFFLRIENFQSLWWNKSLQQIDGFPVSPLQFKLGVTWDFFD